MRARRCASKPASAGSISTVMARIMAPRGEQRQQREEDEREHGRGRDVERPGAHLVQQRGLRRLGAQVHVVAAGDQVRRCRRPRPSPSVATNARPTAPGRIASRRPKTSRHGGDDRARVGDEVGEEEDARERLVQVGRDHRLQRRGQRPEVEDLDQQRPARPERDRREHATTSDRCSGRLKPQSQLPSVACTANSIAKAPPIATASASGGQQPRRPDRRRRPPPR